jgi:hypothetical protein
MGGGQYKGTSRKRIHVQILLRAKSGTTHSILVDGKVASRTKKQIKIV